MAVRVTAPPPDGAEMEGPPFNGAAMALPAGESTITKIRTIQNTNNNGRFTLCLLRYKDTFIIRSMQPLFNSIKHSLSTVIGPNVDTVHQLGDYLIILPGMIQFSALLLQRTTPVNTGAVSYNTLDQRGII
jgi:hypothetical protein